MKAVIFDWDGTLADSHDAHTAAISAVMRGLRLPFNAGLYRTHYTPDWRLLYARLGVRADQIDEASRLWEAAFHAGPASGLLPGARHAVEQLRAAGMPLALVTSGSRAIAEPQIARLGLADLIGVRVFGDDLPQQKPNPAPLRRALRALGLEDVAADTAYLGDAPDDMRMAVAAGVRAVGVVSALSDEPGLRFAGAEQVVGSVAEWVEALLGATAPRASPVYALVIADGDPPDTAALDTNWPGWRDGVGLVVAADGGAISARRAGFAIDLWVGDGDSLGDAGVAELAADGVAVEHYPPDKDESDTELAVLACVARGADAITIVGGLGGRLDHCLANIWLLAHPALDGRPVQLLDGRTRIRLIRAPAIDGGPSRNEFNGRAGDIVTLLPFADHVEGITTDGLRYPLLDEPLRVGPARGLSNVRLGTSATISVRRGLLLIVESPTLTP